MARAVSLRIVEGMNERREVALQEFGLHRPHITEGRQLTYAPVVPSAGLESTIILIFMRSDDEVLRHTLTR